MINSEREGNKNRTNKKFARTTETGSQDEAF